MGYMNQLGTEVEIKEYKEWLTTRPNRFLRHFLNIFELEKQGKTRPKFPELELRISLVKGEMERRE